MTVIPTTPGTYVLSNPKTGSYYIGSTSNLRQRKHQHKYHVNRKSSPSGVRVLAGEVDDFDELEFEFLRFDCVEDAEDLELALLRANVGEVLCCNINKRLRGFESIPLETRLKISSTLSGRGRSDEIKRKISLGKSRKVSCDGVVYESARTAAESLGLPRNTLRLRLYADTKRFRNWFFLD